MEDIRFSVYEHKLEYKNQIIQRNFIVLKIGVFIVAWTDFHKYINISSTKNAISIAAHGNKKYNNICLLLNYVFFEKSFIKRLIDIDVQMVRSFLNDYGLCQLEKDDEFTHRSENTVSLCVSHILDFLDVYIRKNPNTKLKKKDLLVEKEVFSQRKRKYITKKVPAFEVRYNSIPRPIFRDIPESVFTIIMTNIIEKHPRIMMLAALGAFAGLRPAEACNVRREDSPLGAGIRFERINGEVQSISIDLRKELVLRSDLISVGGIKKERNQEVYPAFIPVFVDIYNRYLKYIEGKKYEAEYGALTVNKQGKALTYESYYNEFKSVIKECIPVMLSSSDPEVVNYGHLLNEHNIAPHIFRHWFSVKLTLYGEDVSGLMYWRGDRSPQSSLTYIQNKSDLEKKYNQVVNSIFDYSLWKVGKMEW